MYHPITKSVDAVELRGGDGVVCAWFDANFELLAPDDQNETQVWVKSWYALVVELFNQYSLVRNQNRNTNEDLNEQKSFDASSESASQNGEGNGSDKIENIPMGSPIEDDPVAYPYIGVNTSESTHPETNANGDSSTQDIPSTSDAHFVAEWLLSRHGRDILLLSLIREAISFLLQHGLGRGLNQLSPLIQTIIRYLLFIPRKTVKPHPQSELIRVPACSRMNCWVNLGLSPPLLPPLANPAQMQDEPRCKWGEIDSLVSVFDVWEKVVAEQGRIEKLNETEVDLENLQETDCVDNNDQTPLSVQVNFCSNDVAPTQSRKRTLSTSSTHSDMQESRENGPTKMDSVAPNLAESTSEQRKRLKLSTLDSIGLSAPNKLPNPEALVFRTLQPTLGRDIFHQNEYEDYLCDDNLGISVNFVVDFNSSESELEELEESKENSEK